MENLAYSNNNVVMLNNNTLYDAIETFLAKKCKGSKNTERNYRLYIDNFFYTIFGKHLNEVIWDNLLDIKKLNYNSIVQYQLHLAEKNSNKTANTKIAGIKSLFRDLKRTNPNINTDMFDIERLPETENHYGKLSEQEIMDLIEYARRVNHKGLAQSVYFESLFITAIRKESMLTLTWKDIRHVYDDATDKMVWVIMSLDKGNKNTNTAIPNKLYERMLSVKEEDTDRVFNFSDKAVYKTFESFCKDNDIDMKGRNLTLHSLKHASVIKVYKKYKDIKKAQKQGHHSSASTTLNIYADEISSPSQQPSYNFYETADISLLNNLTKEEIIAIIARCSDGTKEEIINKMK